MAATTSRSLLLGQEFESWGELKNSIIDHGVQAERVTKTYKKDADRLIVKCKTCDVGPSFCKWYLRAVKGARTERIVIKQLNLEHTCQGADVYERRMHTKAGRLADRIFDIVQTNRTTRAVSLRDTLKAIVHPDVPYHSAHSARVKVIHHMDGKEADSFYLIPPHCSHILERDPNALVRWRAPDKHFSNLFVCPSATRLAYEHCRPLVALDGAHTLSTYPQCLLLATALDANQNILVLAYGLCPGENTTEWLWFLELLKQAIPKLEVADTVFLSDREKGLLTGIDDIFPTGHHAYCIWHMKENIKKKFKEVVSKKFDGLVYATSREQYYRRLDRIIAEHPEAEDYLKTTADPEHYSRAFLPARRWGKESSQQAESINRALKPQRNEVPFKMSCLIWDYMMKQYYDSRKLAEATPTIFTPNVMAHLKLVEERVINLKLIAVASSDDEVRVTDEAGREFRVNLAPEWECTCGDFQDSLLPCVHAWRAISITKRRHFEFVSPYYLTDTFRQTYSGSIPALVKEDLVPNLNCGPSLVKRQRGRPTEKQRVRFREPDTVRMERRCRVCHERGHDKRTCALMKGTHTAVAEERAAREAEDAYDNERASEDGDVSMEEEPDSDVDLEGGIVALDSQATEIDCSGMSFSQLLDAVESPTRRFRL